MFYEVKLTTEEKSEIFFPKLSELLNIFSEI